MDNSSLSSIWFQGVGPKQRTAWVLLLILYQVVSPKQWTALSLSFILFQVVSPKQWTAWVYLLSGFKWSVLNNRQLEFTFHLPKNVIPRLSDDEMSKNVIPSVSGPEIQTISLQIHFKISQCLFKILFSFHLSSYCYQHGSGQSFSPSETTISLCSSSFKTSHPCRPTFIITSRAFITS